MDQYTPTSPPMKRRKSTTSSTPVVEYAATIHMQPRYQQPPPDGVHNITTCDSGSTPHWINTYFT